MQYHFEVRAKVYPEYDTDEGAKTVRFRSWIEGDFFNHEDAEMALPDCLPGIIEDLRVVDFTPQRVEVDRLRWVSDDPRFDN